VSISRRLVKKLIPGAIVDRLYRMEQDVRYRHAGRTYAVDASGAEARFLIPTRNEWTDLVAIDERPVIDDLLGNLRADDVFYDVGANIGLYSCLAADVTDRPVIAFEPHPDNAARLNENAELNGADVSLFRCALADSAGEAELDLALDEVGSAGHSLVTDDGPDTITVPRTRGDDLIAAEGLPAPTVLKIDVEGAEHHALEGLSSTLSRPDCRLVYCETHAARLRAQGVSPSDVRAQLASHGFSVTERTVREGAGETFLVAEAEPPGNEQTDVDRPREPSVPGTGD